MSEKNQNKKVSKRVFWTRIVCLVLALIMIGSVCYLAIQLIYDSMLEKKEHEGHDHASLVSVSCSESFENTNGETV